MASSGYNDWVRAGRPYSLIRPARDIQRNTRAHGFTVYDYPNDEHLKAANPQDHTPFSVTGWPYTSQERVRWRGRALDVMPRGDSAAARKEIANLARQIIRDKDAQAGGSQDPGVQGTKAIKYMNWTDENGTCRQENWKTGRRVTTSSTDKGHIHLSFRDDMDESNTAASYDPWARMNGQPAPQQEDDMPFVAKDGNTGQYYVCDMITSRAVPKEGVDDVLYLARQLNYGHGTPGAEWTDVVDGVGWTRLGWSEKVFGTLQGTVKVTVEADAEMVKEGTLQALQSAEGQTALTHAAETAEDS